MGYVLRWSEVLRTRAMDKKRRVAYLCLKA
jgi:hypothetical protein